MTADSTAVNAARFERQPISARRPSRMGHWWLRNRWENLAFVHWAYEPEVVQALLPDGLEVDTFDGKAYVSLVPFEMRAATPRLVPPLPWLSSFAETNVRTYVVDSDGNRAVWFFSLEADRLAIVAFARSLLGFPYVWSDLTVEAADGWRRYETWKRRWPRRPRSTTAVAIEIGDVIHEPDDLDHFLTARWGTVTQWPQQRGPLRHHPVDHPAWELRRAALYEYHDESFQAAGLPAPTGVPIVRWVETIDAFFGRPTRV
ncbi:MAG: YqjF family protein [Ilumatobacter sp.]